MNNNNNDTGRPIPVKTIGWIIGGLFGVLVLFGLILPAFFGKSFFGQLFDEGPPPWALSDDDKKKYEFTEVQAKGREHFMVYCATCHGPDGRGNGPQNVSLRRRPPSFLNPMSQYKNGLTKEGIIQSTREGIPGSQMPAYPSLPDEVVDAMAEYIIFLRSHPELFL